MHPDSESRLQETWYIHDVLPAKWHLDRRDGVLKESLATYRRSDVFAPEAIFPRIQLTNYLKEKFVNPLFAGDSSERFFAHLGVEEIVANHSRHGCPNALRFPVEDHNSGNDPPSITIEASEPGASEKFLRITAADYGVFITPEFVKNWILACINDELDSAHGRGILLTLNMFRMRIEKVINSAHTKRLIFTMKQAMCEGQFVE